MSRIAQELDVPLGHVKAAFDEFAIPRRSRIEEASRGLGAVLTREYLEREYVERARPVAAIAKDVGVTAPTVEAYLVRTGLKEPRGLDPRFDECLGEEALRALYVDEGRTINEVSAKTRAPVAEVRERLRAYGVPIRASARNTRLNELPTEAAVRSASEAWRNDRTFDVLDEEFLRDACEVDGLATREIAELAECDVDEVIVALVHAGISVRVGFADVLSEPFLRRRYVEEEASASEIAREVGTSPSTVASWLDRHGIEVRPRALFDGQPRDEVLTREFLEEQCVRLDRSARAFDAGHRGVRRDDDWHRPAVPPLALLGGQDKRARGRIGRRTVDTRRAGPPGSAARVGNGDGEHPA